MNHFKTHKLAITGLCLLASTQLLAQRDIGVSQILSPISECGSSSLETVQIEIVNHGQDLALENITFYYEINGGGAVPHAQTFTNFNSGQTETITFSVPANLATPGTYDFVIYSELAGDVDTSNDTAYTSVVNYADTEGGNIYSNVTLCESDNQDTLVLRDHIGAVQHWEFSNDNGAAWVQVNNTDTVLVISDLDENRWYRANVQNGLCSAEYSDTAVVAVDPPAAGGQLFEDMIVCADGNSGLLTLSNHEGQISKWQFNEGLGWTDLAHTSDNYSFLDLDTTTQFQVIVSSGVCPDDTSNSVTITVNQGSVGGIITDNDTVCSGANQDTLWLSGRSGDVVRWETSTDDGFTWTVTANIDTMQVYKNLTETTLYRALVQSGICAAEYSDTATILVQPTNDAGTLSQNTEVCAGANQDTIWLTDYIGQIQQWQLDSGTGWIDQVHTSDFWAYENITVTTKFRAFVGNGTCPDDTSNTVTINVISNTEGGNLIGSTTTCNGINQDTIRITNHVGNIDRWEISDDAGASWSPLINTTTEQPYSNLDKDRLFRVLVSAQGCPSSYSDTASVTLEEQNDAGVLHKDMSVCVGANQDTLRLTDYTGQVIKWQVNEGSGWTDINNTDDTLIYTNISTNTDYRVIVGNSSCPNDTSNQVRIEVIVTTMGGNLFESDSVCEGSNLDTINLVGHVGDIKWWERSTDNGFNWTPVVNFTTSQKYLNVTQTTLYRVLVEGSGCPDEYSDTATITVYQPELSMQVFENDSFCADASADITVVEAFTSYAWNQGGSTQTITVDQAGNYEVTVTDFRGCVNTDSVDITVFPLPEVDAGADQTISLGETIELQATGAETYMWSPAYRLSDVTVSEPAANPRVTTQYTVIGTDQYGCQNSDSVVITVVKDYDLKPVNLFTPNGDGINDTWKVWNIHEYEECNVVIMTREGIPVMDLPAYKNDWAGTFEGRQLPDGTYYYVIECTGHDGVFDGHVTILSK